MVFGNNYAIVETANKTSQPDVSVVPECWLLEGFLYWPPGKTVTLHAKKKTIPSMNWQKYSYKILKRNIQTFEEALQECEFYSVYTDTESAEADDAQKQMLRQHPIRRLSYYEKAPNFNKEFLDTSANKTESPSKEKIQPSNTTTYELTSPVQSGMPQQSEQIIMTAFSSTEGLPAIVMPDIAELTNRFDRCIAGQTEMQSELLRRLDQIENKQALILECVQALAGRIHSNENVSIKLNPNIKLPRLPLKEPEDLNMLNVQLAEPVYFDQMVLCLKRFEKAGNINERVRSIMEALLTYELAVQYTWSGKSLLNESTLSRLLFGDKHLIHSLLVKCLQYRNVEPVYQKEVTIALQNYIKRAKARLVRQMKT